MQKVEQHWICNTEKLSKTNIQFQKDAKEIAKWTLYGENVQRQM